MLVPGPSTSSGPREPWASSRLANPPTSSGGRRSVLVLSVLGLELGDLSVDFVHVELLDRVDDLLQRRAGQGAGLVEDHDALAERHQGRDALDAELARKLLVGVGVELREDDVGVLLGGLLVDGAEPLARPA